MEYLKYYGISCVAWAAGWLILGARSTNGNDAGLATAVAVLFTPIWPVFAVMIGKELVRDIFR